MYKILIVSLIFHAVLAVNLKEIRSKKLAPEWSKTPQSNVQYTKTNDLFASMQAEPHEFYESEFSTRLDHFRPLNQQRVNFTFNVNTHNFQNYGLLYIYLKEAYDYSTNWIEEGLMVDIAKETGAALLTFDQRYFGKSRPSDSTSFDALEFLSIEQILADIAVFIRAARQSIPTAAFSRVILWGSGFGGMLAAYARSRYPHLVYASWSSSGIIESAAYSYGDAENFSALSKNLTKMLWRFSRLYLIIDPTFVVVIDFNYENLEGPYDLFEYTFDINDGGLCRELVATAFNEIFSLIESGEVEELANRMYSCDPIDTNSIMDVTFHYESNLRTLMTNMNDLHYDGVLEFCEDMQAVEGNPLDSYVRWLRKIYNDPPCFNGSYATHVERYSNPAWDTYGTTHGRRQFYFLQCTQIGSFLVSDQYRWLPFVVDFNYHLQKCSDVLGSNFTYETVTDAFYTWRDEFSQAITNVLYTNGNLDPLRYFGRTYDPTSSAIVLNIDFALRFEDLSSISEDDRPSILEAKTAIVGHITRWSGEEEPTEPAVEGQLQDLNIFKL